MKVSIRADPENRVLRAGCAPANQPARTIQVETAIVTFVEGEHYKGDYTVTPRAEDSYTLETEGKVMERDVTIEPIPYYTTTNLSGGYTAIIGG